MRIFPVMMYASFPVSFPVSRFPAHLESPSLMLYPFPRSSLLRRRPANRDYPQPDLHQTQNMPLSRYRPSATCENIMKIIIALFIRFMRPKREFGVCLLPITTGRCSECGIVRKHCRGEIISIFGFTEVMAQLPNDHRAKFLGVFSAL